MSAPFRIRRAPFRRGLRWVPAGAELLFSGLGPLAGVAALWLLISLLAVIPMIGQLLIALLTPLLTAGALLAFRMVASGERPRPSVLLAAWNDPRRRTALLWIGTWMIAGSIVAVAILAAWLGGQVSPEQLETATASPEAMAALLSEASIGGGLVLAAVAMALVIATIYFAIPLVMFAGVPVTASLAASLRAVLVNWTAFLAMALVVVMLFIAVGLVLLLVSSIVGLALGAAGAFIAQALFVLVSMMLQMLMTGTQFVAFRDVFELPGADGDDEADDNQLLA